MKEAEIRELKELAWDIRRSVIEMTGVGKAGHIGGSCSAAEIMTVLYGHVMKHDPRNPADPDRDRFIMSKGHAALAQYAVLAEFNYFPKDELRKVKSLGGVLQGHPDMRKTPGIEANTGSLGQGLSIGVGMALGMRLDRIARRVYVMVGDGELAEGQIWEGAMAASHYRLDGLCAIIDANRIQATGEIIERFDTNPIVEKWRAFGWKVLEVDGHDVAALCAAFDEANRSVGAPVAIVARTIKGKGVCFAENTAAYHNAILTQDSYREALASIERCREEEHAEP